jgi:hypothetical protein
VKCAGVLLVPREFPCDFFLWGYMKDLVYSIPIDTIEVLSDQVGNAATIIRNNGGYAGKSGRITFVGAFIIILKITAAPLNTSFND